MAIFFLNCTKNIELTRDQFARTVTFALTNLLTFSGIVFNRLAQQESHSGQRHMKSEEWKTYRTRFLVKAKQLGSSLSFVDHLGRQHCGRKGDYLVESSDGVLSIARRQIFEDIYVSMPLPDESTSSSSVIDEPKLYNPRFEAIEVEEVKLAKAPAGHQAVDEATLTGHHALRRNMLSSDMATPDRAARVRRKLPQPYRDRRASAGLRLM